MKPIELEKVKVVYLEDLIAGAIIVAIFLAMGIEMGFFEGIILGALDYMGLLPTFD
jgi:hypothetical protein